MRAVERKIRRCRIVLGDGTYPRRILRQYSSSGESFYSHLGTDREKDKRRNVDTFRRTYAQRGVTGSNVGWQIYGEA